MKMKYFIFWIVAVFAAVIPVVSADQFPEAPRIYISGGQGGYGNGGLIALTSVEEPAVQLDSYDISGTAKIDVYQATEQDLLNYLTHDAKGAQIYAQPNTGAMQLVKSFTQAITKNPSTPPKVLLPIGESGIWYLNISINNGTTRVFIVRSKTGGLVKEGSDKFIFWGQDFKTKRSITGGNIRLYSLLNGVTELAETAIGANGIAETSLNARADIAILQTNDDRAIIPINLMYLNSGWGEYTPFQAQTVNKRYFIFTDRPLYRPGDTVYFKAIVRDDNSVNYTIPSGKLEVKLFKDYENKNPMYDRIITISGDGTVDGQITLPAEGTGYHQLSVSLPGANNTVDQMDWVSTGYISFDVQYFRKPEYSIDVTGPTAPLISGDTSSLTVHGNYFFGQPLAGQTVKYTLYSTNFWDYQYVVESAYNTISDEYHYGYWGGEVVKEGEVTLDAKGEAKVDFDTTSIRGKNVTQVFSLEAQVVDQSQNPAFSRKNILVYPANFGIYGRGGWSDYWVQTGSTLKLPVVLVPRRNTKLGNIQLTANVMRRRWVVSSYDPNYKYPVYTEEKESLPSLQTTTNAAGNADFNFVPQKPGQYEIQVSGTDQQGNTIAKTFYYWVSTEGVPSYWNNNTTVTVKANKTKYAPSDTAQLFISSTIADRDVFVALERGFVSRYQVVSMNGNSAKVSFPLNTNDIPNIIAAANSFSDYQMDRGQDNVYVSSDSKKLLVSLKTQQTKFGPGDTVQLDVQTKDVSGNPMPANVAVWAVDKAIYELNDTKPTDIFDMFWSERYDDTRENNSLAGIFSFGGGGAERGGCFDGETQITMANGTTKAIRDVKAGDTVLTRSQNDSKPVAGTVLRTHSAQVAGYLIINEHLKVTENHILNVNGEWQEAGSIKIGDELLGKDGKPVRVTSLEWQAGKFTVYNLEIERYHTYFADGVWVHNDKGGGGARTVFKDTAYWNASIQTDSSGHARVSFKLPDNLTTWVVFGIGATPNTVVGQSDAEIVVSKDVIVRPILPNILRVGDKITLSALVQNFTDQSRTFTTGLKFDSGNARPVLDEPIQVATNGIEQLSWNVLPKKANAAAKLTFSATAADGAAYSDTVAQQIPVYNFGFSDKSAQTSNQPDAYTIKLEPDSDRNKTSIKLSFSPSLLGTLPAAMEYLVGYPYGCVEQTTSRFVPALIAKQNADLFPGALKDKDIDDIIKKGISKLQDLQQSEGGWRWWYDGNSDPFITTYVVEYLMKAKSLGYNVPDSMSQRVQSYLEQSKHYDLDKAQYVQDTNAEIIMKTYALTLIGSDKGKRHLDDMSNLSPDLVAMAVLANNRNGYSASAEKGLAILRSTAQNQGDGVFWAAGKGVYFGSVDASTALAVRALLTSSKTRDLAVKGARFIAENRHQDYWSNTFGTVQVIRAITDLTRAEQQISPNYFYSIRLDDKEIQRGQIATYHDTVSVQVPATSIKPNGSQLTISKTGEGQVYSTLVIDQWRTDLKIARVSNGIRIDRKYVNKTHPGSSINVGDVVTVQLTISGLRDEGTYGIIDDQLPSGLIPVNTEFKNEQYNRSPGFDWSWYLEGKTPTENGMILSLYKVNTDSHTYEYDARAVSQGTFSVPPATIQLMYSPEIYGRTAAATLTVGGASSSASSGSTGRNALLIIKILALLAFAAGAWFLYKKLHARS